MRAVVDTSALNYLILIGEVEVLPHLFERIMVPEAVVAELSDKRAPSEVRTWVADPPDWMSLVQSAGDERIAGFRLEAGESEVLSVTLAIDDSVAVLDDWAARQAAKELGVSVVGLLGILVQAGREGHLDLREALAALLKTTFRVRPSLLEEVLSAS